MDTFWDRVLATAIGSLIGGLVAVSTLIVKEVFDRRRAVRTWFEETYITGGIDRLIVYLSTLNDLLSWSKLGGPRGILPKLVEPYPFEAVERVRMLFPGLAFSMLSETRVDCESVKSGSEPDQVGSASMYEIVTILQEECINLEKLLLGVSLARKSQIHSLRDRRKFLPIYERLNARVMKALADSIGPEGREAVVQSLRKKFESEMD